MVLMEPKQVVQRVLAGWLVPGKRYPRPLPVEIAPWHCYTADGGHSIVVVLRRDFRPGADLTDSLVPAPVKSVLRGYAIEDGYVVCDLPYDPDLGLRTPPEDDEY